MIMGYKWDDRLEEDGTKFHGNGSLLLLILISKIINKQPAGSASGQLRISG